MVGGPGNPDTLTGTRGGRLGLQEASHAEQFLNCVVTMRRIVGALTNQEAAGGPSQNGFRRDAQEECRLAWPEPPPGWRLRGGQPGLASNPNDAVDDLMLVSRLDARRAP